MILLRFINLLQNYVTRVTRSGSHFTILMFFLPKGVVTFNSPPGVEGITGVMKFFTANFRVMKILGVIFRVMEFSSEIYWVMEFFWPISRVIKFFGAIFRVVKFFLYPHLLRRGKKKIIIN